jgi:hypothetical protein
MWISQAAYLKDREDLLRVVAERDAAHKLIEAQKATVEFMMLQFTKLEHERNKLLWTFTGVKFPEQVLSAEPSGGSQFDNPMNALPNFNDMGDAEARKQGLGWNESGELQYAVAETLKS